MKIDFISLFDYDASSGRRLFLLAKELAALGHKVTFLSFAWEYKQGSKEKKDKIIDGVKVKYVKVSKNPFNILLKGFFFLLKNLKGDVLILGKALPIHTIPFILVKKIFKRRKKVILDLDDWESIGGGGSLPQIDFTKRMLTTFLEEYMPRVSDGVTTASIVMKKRVEDMGVKNILYLPNGAYPLSQVEELKIEKKKKELKLENEKVIIYTGTISINSYNALKFVLESLKSQLNNFKLVIVGGGDYLEKLKNLNKKLKLNFVTFTGKVPYEEIPVYLALSDIAIVPYCSEYPHTLRVMCSSPRKMFEYMAAGLPIIASNIGELREAIDPKYCFSPNDKEDFVKKLKNMLLLSKKELRKIGEKNKKKVINFYNPKIQAKRLEKFIKKLLNF